MSSERTIYEGIKTAIVKTIESVRAENPGAGQYLADHIVFDDRAMTFEYTGDNRMKIEQVGDG